MFFEQLPQQLVNGIILGSIYALLALGYTMVYGIIKLINFAHGDIYMMGAFVGYYAINSLGMNFWVALVLMVALQLIVKKTKMGKAMRAVSVDSDAAELMGINVNNTISFTFALGSSLAGAAGVLIGLYYNSIEPLMGMTPGIKAFVAAVLGGIGIIPGAALGGFVIGILETLSTAIGLSSYRDAIVYGVLIVILLVRPAGILGKNVKEKV